MAEDQSDHDDLLREVMEDGDSPLYHDPVLGHVFDARVAGAFRTDDPYEMRIGDGVSLSYDPWEQRERYPKKPRDYHTLYGLPAVDDPRVLAHILREEAKRRGITANALKLIRASAVKRGQKNGFERKVYDLAADVIHELMRTNHPDRDHVLSFWAVMEALDLEYETAKRLKRRGQVLADRREAAIFNGYSLANKTRTKANCSRSRGWHPNPQLTTDYWRNVILDKQKKR
jgi:hypothetical protein